MSLDTIIVGGGIGGSTLAGTLARQNRKVLVLERETKFKDRVRGENMLPWGAAAAERLGILEELVAAGGHRARWWMMYMGGNVVEKRDLRETTPDRQVSLNMYHPHLQEVLLERAVKAGAEVRRGATVESITGGPGKSITVNFVENGERKSETARLVVGADGRSSQVRSWGGFEVKADPELLSIAGTMLEGTRVPEDAVHLTFGKGVACLMAPLGKGRARTYVVYPSVAGRRHLTGKEKIPAFLDLCRAAGISPEWLDGVEATGPLAEFVGADRWVESPSRPGLALVGDAAASTDPSWGCGLSLTLLDVENLASCLGSTEDWEQALQQYAKKHDEYYAALHRVLGWMTELAWTPGPAGDERRQRVFPRMLADPTGFPDSNGQGPFGPSDERARRLILGEES